MHRYQYSPTEHELFEYNNPEFFRWFVTEKSISTLVKVPDTKESCITLPSDAYPIHIYTDHSFKFHSRHAPILSNPTQINDFTDYIRSMPRWIVLLLRNYTAHPSSDSLLQHICQQSQLLISTDGSRTHNKSGGSWINALPDDTKLVSRHTPEFGRHVDINSYHSEIYASLASLTFLEYFCDYFSLPLHNTIHVSCDNKSYVTKLNEFISHPYSKLFIHKFKRICSLPCYSLLPSSQLRHQSYQETQR